MATPERVSKVKRGDQSFTWRPRFGADIPNWDISKNFGHACPDLFREVSRLITTLTESGG